MYLVVRPWKHLTGYFSTFPTINRITIQHYVNHLSVLLNWVLLTTIEVHCNSLYVARTASSPTFYLVSDPEETKWNIWAIEPGDHKRNSSFILRAWKSTKALCCMLSSHKIGPMWFSHSLIPSRFNLLVLHVHLSLKKYNAFQQGSLAIDFPRFQSLHTKTKTNDITVSQDEYGLMHFDCLSILWKACTRLEGKMYL